MDDRVSILDRMVLAVEKVRQRLLRTADALHKGKVPYAVVGGNASAAWVATVDPAAVRNTQEVEILLRRDDIEPAIAAMHASGFVYHQTTGIDMFLDGDNAGVRDAVHVIPANEKIRPEYKIASPDVRESVEINRLNLLQLQPLVQMKLTSFRRKDQVHLLDLLEVGLIDRTWPARFPDELRARLQHLLDTPDQ